MNFEIVSSLPGSSTLKAETAYLVQRGSSSIFDLHISDRNKKVVHLTSYVDAPTDAKDYVRNNASWKALDFNNFTHTNAVKLTSENLNTITKPGVYYQSEKSNATLANNYPKTNIRGGTLIVHPVIDNHGVHQVYFSGGTSGAGTNATFFQENPRIFIRKRISNGTAWSAWYEMSQASRVLNQSATTFTTGDNIEDFEQDESTVILPTGASTITINKGKRTTIKYIQSSTATTTFVKGSEMTIVGNLVHPGKVGKEITVTLADTTAYISHPVQPEDTGSKLIGTWS